MKKRLASSLLCLCLILTFLPTAALAADYGNPELPQLGLGTREEIVANTYYLLDEAGSLTEGTEDHYNLYFDDAAKTLFLKDAVLKSSLYVPGGTTVSLDGENVIEQAGTGIQVQGDGGVVIDGTGSLEITSSTEGILVQSGSAGDIVIKGSTRIILHATAYGINLSGTGSVKIEEEAVVVSTGTQPAISGETIVISGNTEVSANSSITADEVLTITDQAVVTAQDTLYGDEGIDILEQADVTVSPGYAEQGEEVTITPKPDTGYQVDEILVTDQNGKKLELEDNGDGTCTFVQPKGKVAIEVTFTEAACDGGKDCPSTAYRDVPVSAWYHEAVDYAIENELMKGYSTSAFGPNDTLTRAMMVQILWNLEGQPVVNYAMQYTDVDTDAWYAEAVRWASSEQIVMGYSEAQFGPEDSITREQMAAVLYRYAQYQDYDTPQSGMAIREYSDYDSISPWALNAMDWAVNAELIDGRGHNLLIPNGTATRAEVAQIFMNFCEKISK